MILKNRSNSDSQSSRRTSLHAPARFIVALALQLVLFAQSGLEANSYDFNTMLNEFLFAFIPTVSMLVLIPVIIRGSGSQKIVAIILSLFPAWIAFLGWEEIINHT
jgi:hypothetical protein